MSSLQFYNSLTGKKEVFEPLHPPHVGLYVCGPTVSGESHLGHARPAITFDVIFRYLLHLGYRVRYVRNITDAGHFEEEGREAVDKISKASTLEKLEPMELVQKYTNLYHWAVARFNCLPPSIEPTATGHIIEQISMIEDILRKGFAYEVNGSVYFDVKKYAESHHYGELSGRVLDDLLETTRNLEGQDEKRHKVDFALWKKAPPEHIMRWKSPWGEGFPGWHIECSAMSSKYLGERFDIHGGGMDLMFPHHECEIAQSTIALGQTPARYWIHNNMITINGKKMGKSYNNIIKFSELFSGTHPLLEKAYDPMTVRFFILQTHYRSTLDFSNEALQAAERGLQRLMDAGKVLQQLPAPGPDSAADPALGERIRRFSADCADFMNDDFNTARVLASLFDMVPVINSLRTGQIPGPDAEGLRLLQETWQVYVSDILGLREDQGAQDDKLAGVMDLLLDIRREARNRKDYATSDKIRDALQQVGITVKDEKDGRAAWSLH